MTELGWTDEPTVLIPGNSAEVRQTAARLRTYGEALVAVGEGLKKIDDGGWRGPAADAFHTAFDTEPGRWIKNGDAYLDAAKALDEYADVLDWAQRQAGEAIATWDAGEAASEAAATTNPALKAHRELTVVTVPGIPRPEMPGDPGVELRVKARDILNEARRQLDDEGDRAAVIVEQAADVAPKNRTFWENVGEFFGGAWDEALGTLSSLNPANWDDVIGTYSQWAQFAVHDPGKAVYQFFDMDTFHDNNARWWGAVLPGLLGRGAGKIAKGSKVDGGTSKPQRWWERNPADEKAPHPDRVFEPTQEMRDMSNRLLPDQANHILNGDSDGGGHRWQPYDKFPEPKSYFPQGWSDRKILDSIQRVVDDPNSNWVQQEGPTGNPLTNSGTPSKIWVLGQVDGVPIRVLVEPAGRGIITGFPPGLTYNHP